MINVATLIETADHSIYLLEEVAGHLPEPQKTAIVNALDSFRVAFNSAGVRTALIAVQEKYSSEAQALADTLSFAPTKPE